MLESGTSTEPITSCSMHGCMHLFEKTWLSLWFIDLKKFLHGEVSEVEVDIFKKIQIYLLHRHTHFQTENQGKMPEMNAQFFNGKGEILAPVVTSWRPIRLAFDKDQLLFHPLSNAGTFLLTTQRCPRTENYIVSPNLACLRSEMHGHIVTTLAARCNNNAIMHQDWPHFLGKRLIHYQENYK